VAAHALSLKSESLEPSDRYGWSAVLRNLLLLLGLLALAPMLADLAPIAPWLLIPFIGLFVYRLTVVMHDCTMLALVTGLGRHPILALLPFVSTATFGLFFSQLRGMAEHGVTDAGASLRNARSHAPHLLDRMLLYDVNFNYHREHHEQPHIPSCHLPALHEQANVGCVATSMLGTIRTLYTSVPWRG
jgi:fatty acid desaturase